jgi:ribosomal protein S18 acetylase RimI-like enzyme
MISIRDAEPEDEPAILTMLADLAEFEGADHRPRLDSAALARDVFGPTPRLRIAVAAESARKPLSALAGFITWFENYSSWEGREGIHVGDLWVCETSRGQGVATALLRHMLSGQDGRRVDVFVVRSNTSAQSFYRQVEFKEQKEWCLFRIDADE